MNRLHLVTIQENEDNIYIRDPIYQSPIDSHLGNPACQAALQELIISPGLNVSSATRDYQDWSERDIHGEIKNFSVDLRNLVFGLFPGSGDGETRPPIQCS